MVCNCSDPNSIINIHKSNSLDSKLDDLVQTHKQEFYKIFDEKSSSRRQCHVLSIPWRKYARQFDFGCKRPFEVVRGRKRSLEVKLQI